LQLLPAQLLEKALQTKQHFTLVDLAFTSRKIICQLKVTQCFVQRTTLRLTRPRMAYPP
jgi:hypothetical protein